MNLASFLGINLFYKNLNFISIPIIIIALSISIPILSVNFIFFFQEGIKKKHIQKNFHLQATIYPNLSNFFKKKVTELDFFKRNLFNFFEFSENNAVIKQHNASNYIPILFRSFEEKFYTREKKRLQKHFPLLNGKWDMLNIQNKFNVIIGENLYKKIFKTNTIDKETIQKIQEGTTFIHLVYISEKTFKKSFDFFPLQKFKLRVIGIFSSSYEDYDNIIFSNLFTSSILFKQEIPFKKYGFFLENLAHLSMINKKLSNLLYPISLHIENWNEKNELLLKAFEWEKQILSVILFIMFLCCIIITLYIHLNLFFFKKRYFFSILQAIFIPMKKIHLTLFILGILISFFGIIFGNILSIIILKTFNIWTIPIQFILENIFYYSTMNQTLNLVDISYLDLTIFLYVNVLSLLTLLSSLYFCMKSISKEKPIKYLLSE